MPVWLTDGERDDRIFYTFTYPPAGSETAICERNPIATCGRVGSYDKRFRSYKPLSVKGCELAPLQVVSP